MSSVKLRTNFIEITLPHGCCPVNLLHICRTAVLTNTYGVLLLQIFIQHACHIFQYKFVSNLGCFLIYFWLVQCSIQNEQPSSSRIFFVPFQTRSMWTVFCKVLLNCLFASWCLIKSLSKCCLNCYVAFLSKNFSTRHCNIVTLPEKIFSNIFRSILFPELSTVAIRYLESPWNQWKNSR